MQALTDSMQLHLLQDAILGESLLWNTRQAAWWWTDIEASAMYQWRENQNESENENDSDAAPRRFSTPDRVGSFAHCRSGKLLLGLANGLASMQVVGDTVQFVDLCQVEPEQSRTRINDGRTDRRGFFVFGTFDQGVPKQAIGNFYQFSMQYGLRRLALPKAAIPNSICFSLDGKTMYFADTMAGVIQQCDYDAESASVSNIKLFATPSHPQASPDGSVIDSDGCLWNAQWGAARVAQYSPQGIEMRVIAVPVKNPTCPAIGGANLDQLMVTSSRKEMNAEELVQMPNAGSLFCITLERPLGVPEVLFDDELSDEIGMDAAHNVRTGFPRAR